MRRHTVNEDTRCGILDPAPSHGALVLQPIDMAARALHAPISKAGQ
jgi:hypothetical protein